MTRDELFSEVWASALERELAADADYRRAAASWQGSLLFVLEEDPSLGVAWALGPSGRTVLHAGAGVYHERIDFFFPYLERGPLGPSGNGRVAVDGSLVGIDFRSTPTAFRGADLLSVLPGLRAGLESRLGDGTDPSVRAIEVLKQGDRIYAPDQRAPYGVHLTAGQVATMTLVAVALSFSNPGIPSGGLFVVTAPVMLVAGLPLDGIGLLIAADAIPDVFNTLVNVTGDMTVAAALAPHAPLAAEFAAEPGDVASA